MNRQWMVPMVTLLAVTTSLAQNIAINQQNKTIAVMAEAETSSDAEIASVTVAFSNYGPTHDAAFKENVRVGNAVAKALQNAGVGKDGVETSSIKVERLNPERFEGTEERKVKQFVAEQSWIIRVAAKDAEKVVAIAFSAGANTLEDVVWFVADPAAEEAKASGAALVKARRIAEQMAQGFGKRLGELLHATNEPDKERFVEHYWMSRAPAGFADSAYDTAFTPTLFPKKVTTKATVRAVFGIE